MVYMMTTTTYPLSEADEVGKKWLEYSKKFPPDRSIAKTIVQAAVKTTTEGVTAIGISEVKPGKVVEALDRAGKLAVAFGSIKGFNMAIEILSTAVEAMDVLGLKPPPT